MRLVAIIILLAKHFNVSIDYLFGVSNVKNLSHLKELITDYSNLSEEHKQEIHDFMKYLLSKRKKNSR